MSEWDDIGDAMRSRATRGAASEMIAAAHLMRDGYHVFRALSSNCPVDMIAWRGEEAPRRVEVKSGCLSLPKKPTSRTIHHFVRPGNELWDLLVVVDHEQRVFIYPVEDFPTFEDALASYRASQDALSGSLPRSTRSVGIRATPGTAERRTA